MREVAHAPQLRPIPGLLNRLIMTTAISARLQSATTARSGRRGAGTTGSLTTQLIGLVLCVIHGPLLIAAFGDPARFFSIGLSLIAFAGVALIPRVPRSVVWSTLLAGAVVHHSAMTSVQLETEVTAAIATGGVLAVAGARRGRRRSGTRRRRLPDGVEALVERIQAALEAVHAEARRIVGWRSRHQVRPNTASFSPALSLLMIARGPPAPAVPV